MRRENLDPDKILAWTMIAVLTLGSLYLLFW
jgi:hypothetical protein